MAQIDRKEIEAALPRKGFEVEEQREHKFFHLKVDGLSTGIKTFISRGSGYKTYGDSLLGMMALQLKVTKADLVDLVKCPLDGPGYLKKLRDRGIKV